MPAAAVRRRGHQRQPAAGGAAAYVDAQLAALAAGTCRAGAVASCQRSGQPPTHGGNHQQRSAGPEQHRVQESRPGRCARRVQQRRRHVLQYTPKGGQDSSTVGCHRSGRAAAHHPAGEGGRLQRLLPLLRSALLHLPCARRAPLAGPARRRGRAARRLARHAKAAPRRSPPPPAAAAGCAWRCKPGSRGREEGGVGARWGWGLRRVPTWLPGDL